MTRFLRWVVEKTLDGQSAAIREYSIGLEVFDRDPSYDPKIDTIVRVEARRLRKKLEDYYAEAGMDEPVRIEIPGPGYVPRFTVNSTVPRPLVGDAPDDAAGQGPRWADRIRRWLKEDA